MPTVKCVEAKIRTVEHFRADFMKNGVNVHSRLEGIPQYSFSVAAPNHWTVAKWINDRFKKCYPGFDVKVYTSNGTVAVGNMSLSTVRGM